MVRRHRHDEDVAERRRLLQIADMSDVEKVEDTVTVHDRFAVRAMARGEFGELVQREDRTLQSESPTCVRGTSR